MKIFKITGLVISVVLVVACTNHEIKRNAEITSNDISPVLMRKITKDIYFENLSETYACLSLKPNYESQNKIKSLEVLNNQTNLSTCANLTAADFDLERFFLLTTQVPADTNTNELKVELGTGEIIIKPLNEEISMAHSSDLKQRVWFAVPREYIELPVTQL